MEETIGKVLFSEEDIRRRAKELGQQITEDFRGELLYAVGTLNGALLWMSDLVKNLDLDLRIDFISAHSYGSGTKSSGYIEITKEPDFDLTGQNILIIEDIIDSGNTLHYLKNEYFSRYHPKCVKICTMLDKPSRRETDLTADYIGFTVENLFIVGYGLDFDQKYRNLPYVSYLEDGGAAE